MWHCVFSYIILDVIEHIGPVLPLVDDVVGKGASVRVVLRVSIVDFLHHLPSLLRTKASHIQVGVKIGVGFLI